MVQTESALLAVLKFSSFKTTPGPEFITNFAIVLKELEDCDALVIDVRENPGGNTVLSSLLAQLLTGKSKELIFNYPRGQLSDSVLHSIGLLGKVFVQSQQQSQRQAMDVRSMAPRMYFKPVVVLTSG